MEEEGGMTVRRGPSDLTGESLKLRFLINVLGPMAYRLLTPLYHSCKRYWINSEIEERFISQGQPIIWAHYHCWDIFYFFNFQHRHHVIMCGDRWGGMLGASLMARVGIETVRRTTRTRDATAPGFISGSDALRELVEMLLEEGYHTAISVDGPRGPRFFVKRGVIDLAEKTGAPILTMSVAAYPRLSVPTWDNMSIPVPFSKVAFIYGGPFEVPSGADDETKENIRNELDSQMLNMKYLCEQASLDKNIMNEIIEGNLRLIPV
jgi:lysophospholipid acyltransferase (LPLAT)-like uncharacterized protein